MSSSQKSSFKSPLFILDDVNDMLTSKLVKKEEGFITPAPRPVTTRSESVAHKRKKDMLTSKLVKKEEGFITPAPRPVTTWSESVAHKRKKPSDHKDEFVDMEKGFIECILDGLAMLKASRDKTIKELEANLSDLRSTRAAEKKIKALKEDLQAAEARVLQEVNSAVDEAKGWSANLVIQARIKMEKQAVAAGFVVPEWNVDKWEQNLAILGYEEALKMAAADQGKWSKGKEVDEDAGERDAVDNRDAMKV